MNAIQIVLAVAVLLWVVRFLARLRARGIERAIGLVIGLAALALVVKPEWSWRLAQLVGVGRGVDLIFYLGFVGFAFLWLHQFSRLRELEAHLTDLTRAIALARAREPMDARSPSTPIQETASQTDTLSVDVTTREDE